MDKLTLWLMVGFVGQALFAARFVVQWVRSEWEGKCIIPVTFWYLSVVGSVVLLAYAVHRMDPVFIAGQSLGILIYCRNLYFVRRDGGNMSVPGAT